MIIAQLLEKRAAYLQGEALSAGAVVGRIF